jgi:hypothetical protein
VRVMSTCESTDYRHFFYGKLAIKWITGGL